MSKKFHPTPEMLRAAETLFVAMTNLAATAPIVDGYQREILVDMKARPASRWADKLPSEPILEPSQAFLLGDEDFATFVDRSRRARDAAGLKVESNDQCPKLVAEVLVMDAKRALLMVMLPLTGISVERADQLKVADREKLIELSLRLLAPFVGDARAVLDRFMGGAVGSTAAAVLSPQPPAAGVV